MEAGNRCKDENLPEEVIRRIVDVTSDVNMCYSEHDRGRDAEMQEVKGFECVAGIT